MLLIDRLQGKAWRFTAECDEMSATFADAGLPSEFFTGAKQVFERLADFKNSSQPTTIQDVTAALNRTAPTSTSGSSLLMLLFFF
eukprot:m.240483 g.240483  ORF g.240483 m.240483 type:complete len:85 (-) comp54404_c0_seq8:1192-1446(-)